MLIVAEVVNVQSVFQLISSKKAGSLSSTGTGTGPAVPPPGTRTGPGPRTAVVAIISWIFHTYIGSFSLYKRNLTPNLTQINLKKNEKFNTI